MLFPKASCALRTKSLFSISRSLFSCFLSFFPPLRVVLLCRFLPLFVAFFSCSLLHCLRYFFFLLYCCTVFSDLLFLAHFPFSLCVCVFCCFLLLLITRLFPLFFCCFSTLLCCFVGQSKPPEMGQSKKPITAVIRPIRE